MRDDQSRLSDNGLVRFKKEGNVEVSIGRGTRPSANASSRASLRRQINRPSYKRTTRNATELRDDYAK